MRAVDKIREKLTKEFSPVHLDVIDQSHLHEGHAGARPGGESHFHVEIKADAFNGCSRVNRQRMINKCLEEDLKNYIHALSMNVTGTD